MKRIKLKKLDIKKARAHAGRTAAAGLAAASLLLGGLFSSPADLTAEDGSTPAAVIVMSVEDTDIAEDDGGDDAVLPEEKRRGVRGALRAWILRLPPWLRSLVGVPLWGLGALLISTLSALWAGVLSPVAAGIVKFLCIAALTLGVLCAALKVAFPDMRLKEMLNKRTVFTLLIGLGLVGAAGVALQILYPEGQTLRELVRWLGGAAVLLISGAPAVIALQKRRKTKITEKTEKTERTEKAPEDDAEMRKHILELADSVKS